ncbi:MAG: 3-hydroxybutyryl-CoA dehydrogenase, partial [Actinomycetota bacterium]
MQIRTVGVVGCGTMGSGICEIAARAGYRVIVHEISDVSAEEGLARIAHSLARAESRDKITAQDLKTALGLISTTTEVAGLSECDLVIEAIPEFLDLKKAMFASLDEVLSDEAIIATNTSSLSVIELAVATKRPERVLGIHFFNPAPVMELVELVKTVTSSQSVVDDARTFVESLGKKVVECRDRAGFIANLLLFPYLNESVKLLEAGFASREDIDAAMRFGAGHPMGPLALLDLVGLDSCAEILESLYRQFHEPRYAPSPGFRHLVGAGYLGRKSGRGFYTFEEPDSPKTAQDNRSG